MPFGNVSSRFNGLSRYTFHVRRGGSRGTRGLMLDVAGIDADGREQKFTELLPTSNVDLQTGCPSINMTAPCRARAAPPSGQWRNLTPPHEN
jgi:hypothetical protein